MSIQSTVQVAIGMIFIWLIMSVAAMYIQEWVVTKLSWRSNMLESAIRNLLADSALASQFYEHPLIKALHSGENGESKPSYIPSSQFSLALFDVLMTAGTEASLIQENLYALKSDVEKLNRKDKKLAEEQLNLIIGLLRKALASEAGDEVIKALMDDIKAQIRKMANDFPALRPAIEANMMSMTLEKKQIDAILADYQEKTGGEMDTLTSVRVGLATMSVTHPQIKQALSTLIRGVEEYTAQGESAVATARQNVEGWFNNSMDRLSGWYKRRAQNLALIIGLSLALVVNVDSLQIATQLWREPALRESLARQAEAFVQQNETLPPLDAAKQVDLQLQLAELNIPVGWLGTPLPASRTGGVPTGFDTEKKCTLSPRSDIDLFGIHVIDQCYPIINTPRFNDLTGWVLKIIGIFISGAATAQGAPFWFDILKKVVNIRSSGANSDQKKG